MPASKIPIGWDVYNAFNGSAPTPLGGRVFNLASIPFVFQEAYANYHGATRGAQARQFLVDILRWLRGGRSTGVVAVSPSSGTVDYGWYPDGEEETLIGAQARSAMQAAGFTVTEYGPAKTADDMFDGADVVIFDQWLNASDTGSPLGQINASETTGIVDYIQNQGRAMLCLAGAHCAGQYGMSANYAYQQGPHVLLSGYAGAEAIFDNTFGGGQTFGPAFWGGRLGIGTGPSGSPAYGLTYPSTKLACWRNGTNSYENIAYAAFSEHEDIGDDGDVWGN